jgi:hypothetical protein
MLLHELAKTSNPNGIDKTDKKQWSMNNLGTNWVCAHHKQHVGTFAHKLASMNPAVLRTYL